MAEQDLGSNLEMDMPTVDDTMKPSQSYKPTIDDSTTYQEPSQYEEPTIDTSTTMDMGITDNMINVVSKESANDLISLLKLGVPLNNNYSGQTILHVGVKTKDVDIVKILLEWGMEPNIIAKVNGWTPAHTAAYINSPEMIDLLVEHGANLDIKNYKGKTPLQLAYDNMYVEVTRALLKGNAKPIKLGSEYEENEEIKNMIRTQEAMFKDHEPLWQNLIKNVKKQNVDKVRERLNDPNIKINYIDSYNKTALHYAVENNDYDMAKLLLENGANPNVRNNYSRRTPILLAIDNNNYDMVELLLDHDSNPNRIGLHKDRNVLQNALRKNANNEIVKLIASKIKNINNPNVDYNTALHNAVRYKKPEYVDILLEYGALPNRPNKDGNTPMHLAIKKGLENIAKKLIKHGANLDKKNKNNISPNDLLTRYGYKWI